MRPSSSPDPRRRLVVAYDVADDGRRERVARVLEDYGVRVQYSVFECVLGRAAYRQLRRVLAARIDPAEDAVAFYRLCRGCGARVRRIGCPPPDADPQYLIL
jgi:CRISPR-associated protein Cas2